MAEKQSMAGYYKYGLGANMSVLFMSDDWPPQVYRFDGDGGEWVSLGESFVLQERALNGDADGPFAEPPEGVPAVSR